MKSIVYAIALCLLCSGVATAAPVTVAWEANPPAEQITKYQVLEGTNILWEGSQTQATIDLTPGEHTLTAKACNVWGCSPPSAPVSTPGAATAPKTVTITVTISVQ